MPISETLRPIVPLIIGLAIGGVGVKLFQDSMPGPVGSPEERAALLEVRLKAAENRVASLEGSDANGRRRSDRTFKDGLRNIGEDIREGRAVSPDDIFRATQPIMRDLAPLFDRMRLRNEEKLIESRVGEYARKYDLSPAQQESLKKWFSDKSVENAERYNDLVLQDGTRLQDVMKFTMDSRPDEGLDGFMEKTLSGENLTSYTTERMAERSRNVQSDADARVERLNSIVTLDDSQRDKIFGIAARDSKDYDPAMGIEGAGGGAISQTNGADSQEAMLSVLRPEQRETYQAEQTRRMEEARKDAASYGLTLPPDWDMLDESGF